MEEFRPASVVAADTVLAQRLIDGDPDAMLELVSRYGAAVSAVVDGDTDVAVDVFGDAWNERTDLVPGGEFGSWLSSLATARVGIDRETRWEVVMATSKLVPATHAALRDHHLATRVDGESDLPDDLHADELRLVRRLAHLGDPSVVSDSLADATSWMVSDDRLEPRVRELITPDTDDDTLDDAPAASRVTRFLRPAIFALGGAALVLFVAIVALSAVSGSPATPVFTVDLTPTGLVREIESGTVEVTPHASGVELSLDAPTLPRRAGGSFYEARLLRASGGSISAGTFSEGADVTLWGGGVPEDYVGVEVVIGDIGDTGNVDVERSTGGVVLKADFPSR